MADFACSGFHMLIPALSQHVKMPPLKDDLVLSEEQLMYVHERLREHNRHGQDAVRLAGIAREFILRA